MIRTFEFAGELADEFTNEPLRFDADDWATTFSAFNCVYPDFKARLRQFDEMVILRHKGGKWESVTQDELLLTFGKSDRICIAAGPSGSGPAAVAYVAEAIEAYGVSAAVATTVAYIAVNVAIAVAASMVMRALGGGGPNTSNAQRDKHASYLYNGAQNVVDQGGAIPLIYGRHRVGGTVISTEISTERMAQLMPDAITAFVGQTTTYNLLSNDIAREYLTLTSWTVAGTTQSPGATYTDASNGFTVKVAADGTVTVTCVGIYADLQLTYTCTDSSTGTSPTQGATIKFVDPSNLNQTYSGGGDTNPY